MIQLPSNIRTTYYTVSVEVEPLLLLAYEVDRIFSFICTGAGSNAFPSFGRSKQEAVNSDTPSPFVGSGIHIYGPEELWMTYGRLEGTPTPAIIIVHSVYRSF